TIKKVIPLYIPKTQNNLVCLQTLVFIYFKCFRNFRKSLLLRTNKLFITIKFTYNIVISFSFISENYLYLKKKLYIFIIIQTYSLINKKRCYAILKQIFE